MRWVEYESADGSAYLELHHWLRVEVGPSDCEAPGCAYEATLFLGPHQKDGSRHLGYNPTAENAKKIGEDFAKELHRGLKEIL